MIAHSYSRAEIEATRAACADHLKRVTIDTLVSRCKINAKIVEPKARQEKANINKQVEQLDKLKRRLHGLGGWTGPTSKAKNRIENLADASPNEIATYAGCEDPKLLIVTEHGSIWDLTKAGDWNKMPVDGQSIYSGCNRCKACIGTKTAKIADQAQLEWLAAPRDAAMVTLTFATDLEKECGYALWALTEFRKKFRRVAKENGIEFRHTVAHEFGSRNKTFRRHFHLTCYCDNWKLLALLEKYLGSKPYADKNGLRFWPTKSWPFGTVHFKLIRDADQARYGGKYAFKGASLAYDPRFSEQRRLLEARGEPILSKYFGYCRPALGRQGLKRLVIEQAPRLMEETRVKPTEIEGIENMPLGLMMPKTENQPERPVLLRQQDKLYVNEVLSEWAGEKVLLGQVNMARDEYRNAMLDEALIPEPTRWIIE